MTAISLGVRFIRFAFKAISKYFIPQCHLWSDSTTALNWLNSKTEPKDLFIRDRVNDLAKKSKLGEKELIFHYVVSEINPADLLTKDKGSSVKDPLWINGPKILHHSEQWLKFEPTLYRKDVVPTFCGTISNSDRSVLPQASDSNSLKELYDKTIKLNKNLNKRNSDSLQQAETLWINYVQELFFSDVVIFLRKLKDDNIKSVSGKNLIKKQKLIIPQICLNLHFFWILIK